MTDLDRYTHRDRPLYIGGTFHAGQGDLTLDVINPRTNEVFAQIATASPSQVKAACHDAKAAFASWRHSDANMRAELLEAFANGLKARREDLIALQRLNNGKPRQECEFDVDDATACFEYYAGLVRAQTQPDPEALFDPAFEGRRIAKPIGPVGMIVPWNFPLTTSAWKLAPALGAGCTVVLKLSEITPLAELVYADIAHEAGLPAGVLNILTGAVEVGAALGSNPDLCKLSFTGSNAVGAKVMAASAAFTRPVTLELGGKSPIVVRPDADPEMAAELVADGVFMNCGQMCSATSRLIVHKDIADEVIDRVVERARTLINTLGADDGYAPITMRAQYDKLKATFARAEAAGIMPLVGGYAPDNMPGYFVAPTIYDEPPRDSFIWREELFGPVLAIHRYESESQAVTLANDTEFGLAATVVSGDEAAGQALAEQIDAGHIWVNTPQIIMPDSLWGGFRASGFGRELGPQGLAAYQSTSIITSNRASN